jgi:hypothetical protein
VPLPLRILAAVGSVLLLYVEPLWIAIGPAVPGVAVAAQLVLSRGGPHPAGTNDRP